jgi:hypothetical protein
LTHAAICDYRLEPGDIDIIISPWHTPQIRVNGLNPVSS